MRKAAIFGGCLCVAFSAAALAGCGGNVTPGTTAVAPAASLAQPAKKKGDELIYVSDIGNGSVDVYTYPQGKTVATIGGFTTPFGVCTDKKGNVFATDQYSEVIQEYAHGGTTSLNTLYDENHNPAGCAYDKKTGDLAVANESSTSGVGGVSIFSNETKLSTFINGPNGFAGWFCTYDKKGNLFIDGFGGSGSYTSLLELPKGSSTLETITLPVAPYGAGGLAWKGKDLLLADEASTVYELSISGTKATKVGEIKLQDANSVYGILLAGKDLVGAESNGKAVGIWKYPAGGKPLGTITGPSSPLDVVISK